jgi:hypothetical protein
MIAFVIATLLVPLMRNVLAPKGPAQASRRGRLRAGRAGIQ